MSQIIFAEYGIPRRIVPHGGTNFILKKFREVCKKLNIHHTVSSLYSYQSNGQVETCLKFIKGTMMKCFDTKLDTSLALLQIRDQLNNTKNCAQDNSTLNN